MSRSDNSRVARVLNLVAECRPDEVRSVLLMFVYSVLLGTASVFYENSANTLFLASGDGDASQKLPYVYLLATLITASAAALYSQLESQIGLMRLLTGVQAALLLSVAAFRVLLVLTDDPAHGHSTTVTFAIRVFWEVLWMLMDMSFWAMAVRMFTLRQGKRLFAFMATGEVVAEIFGGLMIGWLTTFLDVADLLGVAALALGGCTAMPYLGMDTEASNVPDAETASAAAAGAVGLGLSGNPGSTAAVSAVLSPESVRDSARLGWSDVVSNRYLLLILTVAGLNVVAFYYLNFAYMACVEKEYDDPRDLAAFLGNFSAITGLVNLLAKATLAGWLLNRFGVRAGLLALPAVLAVGALITVAVGWSAGFEAVFWPLVITKICERVLNESLYEPATRILYQPVPSGQRVGLAALSEGIVSPVTAGITGASLALFTAISADFGAVEASWILLASLVALGFLSFDLANRYGFVLGKSLARRSLELDLLNLSDGSSRRVLARYLDSHDEMEVIYALNLLTQRDRSGGEGTAPAALEAGVGEMLLRLLNHPGPAVRTAVLEKLEHFRPPGVSVAVRRLIDDDPAPAVAGAAVQTLMAVSPADDVLDMVASKLSDPRPEVRRGAMVGLLRDGGVEGVLAAGEKLLALVRSESAGDRTAAAEVLGHVGIRSFYRALLSLLNDPEPSVRRVALQAAGQVANPALWPLVIPALSVPALRAGAVSALVAGGESALPALEAALDRPGISTLVRVQMLRVIRRIGGPGAITALHRRIEHSDGPVRREALAGLGQLNYQPSASERNRLTQMVIRESARATWLLASFRDLAGSGFLSRGSMFANLKQPEDPLCRALLIEFDRTTDTMFLLLELLFPSPAIRDARLHLEGASIEKHSLAVEVIDQSLPRDLKEVVLPLLEDLPDHLRLAKLEQRHPQPTMSVLDRLRAIVEGGGTVSSSVTTLAEPAPPVLAGVSPAHDSGRHDRLSSDSSSGKNFTVTLSLGRDWLSPWTRACALHRIVQENRRSLSVVAHRYTSHPDRLIAETAAWVAARLAHSTADSLSVSEVPRLAPPRESLVGSASPSGTKPELAKPELTKPELAKPELTKPDLAKPELTKPELTKLDLAKPDFSKPELTKPETPKPSSSPSAAAAAPSSAPVAAAPPAAPAAPPSAVKPDSRSAAAPAPPPKSVRRDHYPKPSAKKGRRGKKH